MGISLKMHVRNLGWPEKYLDTYGKHAAISMRDGLDFFVPVGWFARKFSDQRLLI